MLPTPDFYVYRWIRLDTNTPFYIGKGRGGRAFKTSGRSLYFKRIYYKVPCRVEIFIKDLTEKEAFYKEIEFIKIYRTCGLRLCNITDGGEGVSGYTHSIKSRYKISLSKSNPSDETRARMSSAKLNPSEVTRKKMSNAKKNMSPETKAKMSLAKRNISKETRDKMSKAKQGTTLSTEARRKISEAHRGMKRSPEARAKMAAARSLYYAKKRAALL